MAENPTFHDLMEFPAEFLFRIVVHTHDGVTDRCVEIIQTTLGRSVLSVEEQHSAQGRYRSVRVNARVETADEIYAVYGAFKEVEFVKLML